MKIKDMNKYLDCSQAQLNRNFLQACNRADLGLIEYLLMNEELPLHADIHCQNDWALQSACSNGRLGVVKYLLASPDLSEHADIHANKNQALKLACVRGYLEVVKYLLTSTELSEHANINSIDAQAIENILKNEQIDVLNYLLYDMRMQVTPEMHDQMDRKSSKNIKRIVSRIDLYIQMDDKLPQSNETQSHARQKI